MLSIGILSWRAHITLRKTLESYETLAKLADECVIFFNEITEEDRAIAAEFGFRAEGSPENLGIMGGTCALLNVLHGDKVILLQNDRPVCVPPDILKQRLDEAIKMVDSGRVKFVQMHARFSDGPATNKKFAKYYPGEGEPDTFKRRLLRLFRPIMAERFKGRAVWSLKHPEERFPEVFTREGDIIISDSSHTTFSEQPNLAKREFLAELFAWCEAHKEGKHTLLNGQTSIEIVLNRAWWRRQRFPIGISEGVFAHARYDDSFRATDAAYNPNLFDK